MNDIISFNSFNIERVKRKRVGRGIGSGRGVKCGAGDKGQSARSGTSLKRIRAKFARKFPKIGFRSKMIKPDLITVKQILYALNKDPSKTKFTFLDKKLIGSGEIEKPIHIVVGAASKKCAKLLKTKGCIIEIKKKLQEKVNDI